MKAWLPRIYWQDIPAGDVYLLNLDPRYPWEGLFVEWRGRSLLLVTRVKQ